MAQGRVKWYSAEVGYGFILPYDGETELLVRREYVSDSGFGSLEKSVEVTYEAVEGREGPEAKNIHKV
jgi:cold shock protein